MNHEWEYLKEFVTKDPKQHILVCVNCGIRLWNDQNLKIPPGDLKVFHRGELFSCEEFQAYRVHESLL